MILGALRAACQIVAERCAMIALITAFSSSLTRGALPFLYFRQIQTVVEADCWMDIIRGHVAWCTYLGRSVASQQEHRS